MLKILQIITSLEKGGAERLVIEICKNLALQNLAEVMLVVMNEINEYEYLTGDIPINYCSSFVIPSITGKAKIDISEYSKIVTDFEPDIIHSHLYEAELLSRWKIYPHIKYVSHFHGNTRQLKKRSLKNLTSKDDITDYYERQLIIKKYRKCNNHFIAISTDTELFLKENLPKDLHRIMLLNNAIDITRFKRPDHIIKKTINTDKIRLINIGSFVDNKNQAFLIDVVAELHKQGYKVILDLIGYGVNQIKIEKKIIDAGLTEYIFCHGMVKDVENYLNKADIYVHSALSEAFGLTMIESMAAGLPVVCLDGKGNRDIIRENFNGFMIKSINVELFVNSIIQLIKDKKLYSIISENAENFAKDYDIKNYVEELKVFYESIV